MDDSSDDEGDAEETPAQQLARETLAPHKTYAALAAAFPASSDLCYGIHYCHAKTGLTAMLKEGFTVEAATAYVQRWPTQIAGPVAEVRAHEGAVVSSLAGLPKALPTLSSVGTPPLAKHQSERALSTLSPASAPVVAAAPAVARARGRSRG